MTYQHQEFLNRLNRVARAPQAVGRVADSDRSTLRCPTPDCTHLAWWEPGLTLPRAAARARVWAASDDRPRLLCELCTLESCLLCTPVRGLEPRAGS